jgi:hypothetical protein
VSWRWAALAVLAAAVAVVSPLTLWCTVAVVPAVSIVTRGLDPDERRRVRTVAWIAIGLRVLVVIALFLATDHGRVPFGTFFGDEDYFIRRSLWLRNVAMGLPLHPFDLEYAFEPNGTSSLLHVLAFIQAVTGPAPYALHLVGILFYVLAVLLLYRVARRSLGPVPAMFGLIVLLFLPSLFAWSVAVLKESAFVLVGALALSLTVVAVRSGSWPRRIALLAAIAGLIAVQGTIRAGGAAFSLGSIAAGLVLGFVVRRPRLLAASIVCAPILAALVMREPAVQLRAYVAIQRAARQHWGAVVVSQGNGYQLLDQRFYRDVNTISDLGAGEAARYVARAAASFVFVPLPWNAPSRTSAAYIPEQVLWYVLAALLPAGIVAGFRRDPLVTSLLIAHAATIAIASALTDGNVGTLVRHRGLVFPYIVWLSGAGACALLGALTVRQPVRRLRTT